MKKNNFSWSLSLYSCCLTISKQFFMPWSSHPFCPEKHDSKNKFYNDYGGRKPTYLVFHSKTFYFKKVHLFLICHNFKITHILAIKEIKIIIILPFMWNHKTLKCLLSSSPQIGDGFALFLLTSGMYGISEMTSLNLAYNLVL